MFEIQSVKRHMKAVKFLLASFFSVWMITACNNSTGKTGSALDATDTSSSNPSSDAMDYHPDQRQVIPTPDSSNTIGTDTINGSETTQNTSTQKSYNNKKAGKDTSKKQ
jgi:hypothetical protein